MPCTICDYYYTVRPCDSRKNSTSDDYIKKSGLVFVSKNSYKGLRFAHLMLAGSCPCEDCLVKMICESFCDKYNFRTIPLY